MVTGPMPALGGLLGGNSVEFHHQQLYRCKGQRFADGSSRPSAVSDELIGKNGSSKMPEQVCGHGQSAKSLQLCPLLAVAAHKHVFDRHLLAMKQMQAISGRADASGSGWDQKGGANGRGARYTHVAIAVTDVDMKDPKVHSSCGRLNDHLPSNGLLFGIHVLHLNSAPPDKPVSSFNTFQRQYCCDCIP